MWSFWGGFSLRFHEHRFLTWCRFQFTQHVVLPSNSWAKKSSFENSGCPGGHEGFLSPERYGAMAQIAWRTAWQWHPATAEMCLCIHHNPQQVYLTSRPLDDFRKNVNKKLNKLNQETCLFLFLIHPIPFLVFVSLPSQVHPRHYDLSSTWAEHLRRTFSTFGELTF